MIVRRGGVGEVIPAWAVGAYSYTPPPGGGVQMGTAAHAALLAGDRVRYSFSSGGDRAAVAARPVAPVRAAIARRYPVQASAVNYRRRPGMGGVNEDSEKVLQAAGFKNVDCKFVAYQGPFGGGTNVCDVDGDNAGYAYGAELVGAPGGAAILKTEIANASRYMAERAAEQARIQAERAAAPVIPAAPPPSPFTPPAASGHSPAALPVAPVPPIIRAVDPPAAPPAAAPVVPSTPTAPGSIAAPSWLTDSMFGGVPNWLLGVGVLGVALAVGGGGGRR